MKKILYMMIVALCFAACEEYEMIQYGKGARINFMGDINWASPGTSSSPLWSDDATLKYTFNFGINAIGENLLYDTLQVGVKIMGDVVSQPRKVTLMAKSSGENILNVIFPDEYYVGADTTAAVFRIVIERPANRGVEYNAELLFNYENSAFEEGSEERQVVQLIISDCVSKELWGVDDRD